MKGRPKELVDLNIEAGDSIEFVFQAQQFRDVVYIHCEWNDLS